MKKCLKAEICLQTVGLCLLANDRAAARKNCKHRVDGFFCSPLIQQCIIHDSEKAGRRDQLS